eukprot:5695047-Amphidinium_carterae.1
MLRNNNNFGIASVCMCMFWGRGNSRRERFWAIQGFKVSLLRACSYPAVVGVSQCPMRFFKLYQQWKWDKIVTLCEILDPKTIPG